MQAAGAAPAFAIACAPGIAAGPDSRFRVASLSKIVTARTFRAVAAGRLADAAACPAEDLLGFPLRHPAAPRRPVTTGELAAHMSGLTDAGGYLIPPDRRLGDWIAARGGAIWGPAPPGAAFAYCNLGHVLLAACAERLGGAPFGELARRHVLAPLGIGGGFNWWGVADRSDRLPTFRRRGADGRFEAQIDAAVAPAGLSGPDGAELLPPYAHAGLFSPQGGLRLSLREALTLAASLAEADAAPLWRDPAAADPLFPAYGWGVQVLDSPAFHPRPLVGHCGNAYGFRGGVWLDRGTGRAFAYALNGFPEGEEDDALRPEELALFQLVAELP